MCSTKIHTAATALIALAAFAFPISSMAIEPLQWANEGPRNSQGQPVAGNPASVTRQDTYTLASRLTLDGRGGLTRRWELVEPFLTKVVAEGGDVVAGGQELKKEIYGWYGPTLAEGYGQSDEFTPGRQWQFIRQPGLHPTPQIPATETVAIYNTAFHRYSVVVEKQLAWSLTPQYEWQVAVGDAPTIPGEKETELYNTIEQGYLTVPEARPSSFLSDLLNGIGKEFGLVDSPTGPGISWVHAPFSIPKGYVTPMLVKTGPINEPQPPIKEAIRPVVVKPVPLIGSLG
jgi:hypothetical protein